MRYPDIGKLSEYRAELRAAMRRRRESRSPRVRVRNGHYEPRLLADDDPRTVEILDLARRVADVGRTRGSSGGSV